MPVRGDFQEGAPMESAPIEGGHFGGDIGEVEGAPQAQLKGFARPNASAN